MALEHLNEEEYQAFKERGLVALNDDAYERLKLNPGYGKTELHREQDLNKPVSMTEEFKSQPQGITPILGAPSSTDIAKGAPQIIEQAGKGFREIGQLAGEAGAKAESKLGKAATGAIGIGSFGLAEHLDPQTTAGKAASAIPLAGALGGLKGAKALATNTKVLKETARGLSSRTGLMEKDVLDTLNDLDVFKRAKSVTDATSEYVKGIPGLKHFNDWWRSRGYDIPDNVGDYKRILRVSKNILKDPNPNILPQEKAQAALSTVQATNKLLRHREFSRDPDAIRAYVKDKNDAFAILEQVFPGAKERSKALRDAYLVDDWNNLLPINKNKTVSKLGSGVMGAAILAALKAGTAPGAALMAGVAALHSPKAVSLGLRGANVLFKERKLPKFGGFGKGKVAGGPIPPGAKSAKPTVPSKLELKLTPKQLEHGESKIAELSARGNKLATEDMLKLREKSLSGDPDWARGDPLTGKGMGKLYKQENERLHVEFGEIQKKIKELLRK
jgi:hypothetical protein